MQRKHERIVRSRFGELFIETSARDWLERLEAWKADHTKPCPMPAGHLIFRHPEQYGAELIEPA